MRIVIVVLLLAMAPNVYAQDDDCLSDIQAIHAEWGEMRETLPQNVAGGIDYYLNLARLRERVTDIEGCEKLANYLYQSIALDGDFIFVQMMTGLELLPADAPEEWEQFIEDEADELEDKYQE